MIDELIDKQDSFEIVRDQIAAILVTEINNQMQLAIQEGKDPNDWKLRIFKERWNPWEQWLDDQDDVSPIVNISYDNSNFNSGSSNIVERQKSETIFNIDCYGYGLSEDDVSGGHIPGDREANFEVQKAIRFVRNILMAAEYTFLGLQGLVWHRWPQSIVSFQPQLDGRQMQKIAGARIQFMVWFNELSPQVKGGTLELLSVTVYESGTGEILINPEYDYSSP